MSGASGGSTHAPSRCLYAALNVPRNATSTEIKKAYRKEALVWHPDKNVGNEAEAQVRFQELQHAYAVLSDPHERRWYDDHRDEILNPSNYGDDGDSDAGMGGHTVNLTPFFSAAAFSGFGDDEAGFYQTYARAFQKVWESERDWGTVSADGSLRWGQGDAPSMGRSSDDYETADSFYSSWVGFVSGLSFGWVDDYNVNEAENRRVRRLMEKENGKMRATARRKYQDDVRALAEFCRRRDRRVVRHKLKLAKDKEDREKRRREEALQQKEELRRRREEWAKAREEEAEEEEGERSGGNKTFRLADEDSEEDDSEDDENDDSDDQPGSDAEGGEKKRHGSAPRKRKNRRAKRRGGKGGGGGGEEEMAVFVCAVCKKEFKSKGQMANHETSKAHKKKLKELDAEMLREAVAKVSSGQEEEEEEEEESDEHGSSVVEAESDGEGDVGQRATLDEEKDFFVDSAMRGGLDLDDDDDDDDDLASGSGVRSYEALNDSGSDGARAASGRSGVDGPPESASEKRSRARFAFGDSSDSSSSSGSESDSDSDSDSTSSGSDTDSNSGSGGGGLGGSGEEGSGDAGDDPSLLDAIEAASSAANQLDPSGDIRTAAAMAASAAAVAAANSAAGRFHLGEDLGEAVSAATSAGLSWWKKHKAKAKAAGHEQGEGDEEGDASEGDERSDASDEDEGGDASEGGEGGSGGNSQAQAKKGLSEQPAKGSGARRSEDGCGRKGHAGAGSGGKRHHRKNSSSHAHGGGGRRRRAREGGDTTSSGEESGGSESEGSTRGEDGLGPAGRLGRRKAGAGKHAKGGPPAADDKGARRRRRQALKAGKAGRGRGAGGRGAGGGGGGGGGVGRKGKEGDGLGLNCRVCGMSFPSRSKLFAHVKAEGHAVLK